MATTAVAAPAQPPFDEMLESFAEMSPRALGDIRWRLERWRDDPATVPFDRHLREHRCTERDIPPGSPGGFGYCDEAMRLFNAMAPHNKVLLG